MSYRFIFILAIVLYNSSCQKKSIVSNCYTDFCGNFEDSICVRKFLTHSNNFTLSSEEKYKGNKSLELNQNDISFNLNCFEKNRDYTLSFALKISENYYQQHPISVLFSFNIPSKRNFILQFVNTDTSWHQMNFIFTADSTTENFNLHSDVNIPIFIDDLRIE